jgi:hypothetical protein
LGVVDFKIIHSSEVNNFIVFKKSCFSLNNQP